MWLGLLGPLSVRDGDRSLIVTAAKQRVLLALLAVHANHVVSFDEIADTMWNGAPAPGAHATVRNYVLRLRKVLGPDLGARIVTRPLIEARLQVLESRFEAALRLGRTGEVLAELETASIRNPLREPFHVQLMLALYRTGRQADALAIYGRVRRTLAGELGIEPGAQLRRLHDRILRADPGLIGEPATAADLAGPPRQLPAGTAHFAGRAGELKELSRLFDQLGERTAAPAVALVGGTAGIGKTTLALHWAPGGRPVPRRPALREPARVRSWRSPVRPAEAIRGFLDGLAVPAARIPAGEQEQASLYRSILADRRVLVVRWPSPRRKPLPPPLCRWQAWRPSCAIHRADSTRSTSPTPR